MSGVLKHYLHGSALALLLLATPVWADMPQQEVAHESAEAVDASSAELPEISKIGPVSTFTLQNGLQVVVIENHRAPVVTQMVWYRVGSADEPKGVTGIAHFLEHLMFKGTSTHKEGEFSKRIVQIGGEENAFTYYDYTAYHQSVASQFLPEMMAFEADRMTNLVLDDKAVTSERAVIIEERSMRVDNKPSAILGEEARATLFLNSPYHNPVIGWKHEMEQLSRKDAIDFYNRFYTPNNAILVLSGDVSAEKARELALATYGKVKVRANPGPRLRPQEPPQKSLRTVSMHDPRVSVPQFDRMWVVPSYHNAENKNETVALDILAEILGGAPRGRLYRSLIVEKQNAAAVSAGYEGTAVDDGIFYYSAMPRDANELQNVETTIADIIENIRSKGVSQAEVDQARNRLIKSMIFSYDSPSGMAGVYGAALAVGLNIEDVSNWPDDLKKVTPTDVQKVAQKYLDPQTGIKSTLLPPHSDAVKSEGK